MAALAELDEHVTQARRYVQSEQAANAPDDIIAGACEGERRAEEALRAGQEVCRCGEVRISPEGRGEAWCPSCRAWCPFELRGVGGGHGPEAWCVSCQELLPPSQPAVTIDLVDPEKAAVLKRWHQEVSELQVEAPADEPELELAAGPAEATLAFLVWGAIRTAEGPLPAGAEEGFLAGWEYARAVSWVVQSKEGLITGPFAGPGEASAWAIEHGGSPVPVQPTEST